MLEDIKVRWSKLNDSLAEMRGYLDVDSRLTNLAEMEARATAPDFWNDQAKAREAIEATNLLKAAIHPFVEMAQSAEEIGILVELMEADPSGQAAHLQELEEQLKQVEAKYRAFELQSLLSGKLDPNNAYLSLHAGAGGTESCDWADMLFRMYRRYCEGRGFEVSILDYLPGEEAGIKSITFMVKGPFAFGYLKAERGVHRLVRISPFDAAKRRHTSFTSLDVVAEVDDEIDIQIDEKDLRIDTYRSGGAGGQKVNKTDSAVRITHLPTGVVAACQVERSQHSNRYNAMKMLRAKLYELEMDKKRKEQEKCYGEKGEIAWGHQIRSYVLQPYTMVKDHRTDYETGNTAAVLDGDLDPFIEAYLKQSNRSGEPKE
ncbi:MAG: peptide chain release factor 2 [Lentisphaerota bacterium]